MTHIHWVTRQNKRVRSRHDGSPTHTQADTESRSPRQGVTDHCLMSRRRRYTEEVVIATVLLAVVRDVFLKLKQRSEAPQWKSRTHVSTQISMRRPPYPNHTPTHHTNHVTKVMGECVIQRRWPSHRHPNRHSNPKPSPGRHRPLSHVTKKTLCWGSGHCHDYII
jgi:hypothetical protein